MFIAEANIWGLKRGTQHRLALAYLHIYELMIVVLSS